MIFQIKFNNHFIPLRLTPYALRLIFIVHCSLLIAHCQAQINLGIPSIAGKPSASSILRDYECIGINPSNLGWDNNNRISFGLLYFNIDLQSKALNVDELVKAFQNMGDDFKPDEKVNYAKMFNTNNGLNLNSNMNWVGFSLNLNRIGGFGVSLRDRFISHFSANKEFSDILFNGVNSETYKDVSNFSKPVSEVFNGTDIKFQHLRELNLSYGVKITTLFDDIKIYGGIGFRYIWGLSHLNVKAENNLLTAFSSLNGSDYKINMGAVDSLEISNAFESARNIFNAAGSGSAIDLGVNVILFNKLKFGASLIDLGSVTWKQNAFEGVNINMKQLDVKDSGLANFNVIKQIGYLFNKDGLIEFRKVNSFKTDLAKQFRMGVGYKPFKFFEIGADMVTALNDLYGNKGESYYSLGAELNIFKIFRINTGLSGNSKIGWNVPVGITLSTRGYYEIYLATNDVLMYFNRTKNPLVSVAFCAVRFNLPKKNK